MWSGLSLGVAALPTRQPKHQPRFWDVLGWGFFSGLADVPVCFSCSIVGCVGQRDGV